MLRYILFEKKFIFSIKNGQPREPALCQLYRHTFGPYSTADKHRKRMFSPTFSSGLRTARSPWVRFLYFICLFFVYLFYLFLSRHELTRGVQIGQRSLRLVSTGRQSTSVRRKNGWSDREKLEIPLRESDSWWSRCYLANRPAVCRCSITSDIDKRSHNILPTEM